jgi:WhiB family redox-sensing transcriptional regulator
MTPPADIDTVAVHRVTLGHLDPTALTADERHRAAYVLTARGHGAKRIADLLGVTQRTIGRWRTRGLGVPPAPETDGWKDDAACAGNDPRHFFPDDFGAAVVSYQRARAVCARCPVRSLCLDAAMDREGDDAPEDRSGMWGGLSPEQRAALARARQPRPTVLTAWVRPTGAWDEAEQARHRAELLEGLRETA